MAIEFQKYHGLENDFLLIEGEESSLSAEMVVEICHRRRGVGADGVLLVSQVRGDQYPSVRMVIFNRDASRPEMCGNGVRCVAAYAERQWGMGPEITVFSDAGPRRCVSHWQGANQWQVSVEMGAATVTDSPLLLHHQDTSWPYWGVNVGNPHAVIFSERDEELAATLGRLVNQDHPDFPEGTNLEFASQRGKAPHFDVIVFERGVGFTRACGTGACAVAAAAWADDRVSPDQPVIVELPGGPLTISQSSTGITMAGEAAYTFAGTWGTA